MDWTEVLSIFKEAGVITLIVTALMLCAEALDYALKGRLTRTLKGGSGSVALSSLLGAVPGCAGGYFSVSLYSRGMFSFGALLAMMISTTGDEAFLMLALFPKKAVVIFAVLALLGIVVGLIYDATGKHFIASARSDTFPETASNLRGRLLHVLPHALRVFEWTFFIMLVVGFASRRWDVAAWIASHPAIGIIAAIVVGMIPQSGPHMAFVSLYAQGVLPLPVLIASCIMQEGHAGLPLLSADRAAFFRGKAIKAALALLISVSMTVLGL